MTSSLPQTPLEWAQILRDSWSFLDEEKAILSKILPTLSPEHQQRAYSALIDAQISENTLTARALSRV